MTISGRVKKGSNGGANNPTDIVILILLDLQIPPGQDEIIGQELQRLASPTMDNRLRPTFFVGRREREPQTAEVHFASDGMTNDKLKNAVRIVGSKLFRLGYLKDQLAVPNTLSVR